MNGRNPVGHGLDCGGSPGRHEWHELRNVGPEVGNDVDLQGNDAAGAVEGHPPLHDTVAALQVADEALAAICRPLDRTLQPPRGDQHEDILVKEEILHAEGAADISGQDAKSVSRHLENVPGQGSGELVGPLGTGMEDEASALGFVVADRGTRLQGCDDHAVVDHLEFHHTIGRSETAADRRSITHLPVQHHISRRLLPQLWRIVSKGPGGAGHGIERMVVDLDRFTCISGRLTRLRHHESHRFADMSDPAGRQNRVRNGRDGRSVPVGDRARERQGADSLSLQVGGGQDKVHTGRGAGFSAVDASDGGVRMG